MIWSRRILLQGIASFTIAGNAFGKWLPLSNKRSVDVLTDDFGNALTDDNGNELLAA